MKDDEGRGVDLPDDALDLADFQAGHDTVDDVTFRTTHAAVTTEHRDAATQVAGDPFADGHVLVRHDGDGGVFVDAVENEIEGLGGGDVCQDRIQRLVHPENSHRNQE